MFSEAAMPAMDRYRDVWPGVELDLLGGFHADPVGLLLDARADLVVTSDVMEHVRLDDKAHREIHRVLADGGVYVSHDRGAKWRFVGSLPVFTNFWDLCVRPEDARANSGRRSMISSSKVR